MIYFDSIPNMMLYLMVLAYLLGSIPFGYIIAKSKNIDIRKKGSGSTGGTNIYRVLGMKYAALTALLDLLKGLLPTLIATTQTSSQVFIGLVGLFAVIGHIFPIFLQFKGGKGVGTSVGFLLVAMGAPIIVMLFLIWILLLKTIRIMSLVNLTLALFIPFIFLFFLHSTTYCIISILLVILIYWSHRENIKRLAAGKESRLK
jgi:glycerol-3-phosphate acyltransferase PlsY